MSNGPEPETPEVDGDAGLSDPFGDLRGPDARAILSDGSGGTLVEATDDEAAGRGAPRRIVAEKSVDEVFERFEENSPEDVMDADDPALESPTEAELRSIGQQDGLLGELPDPPKDARDPDGFGAFVEETDGMLEKTGEDTHRSVGDSDVDAVFERYEEDTVEDVIEADDLTPEADEMVETEVDESVDALFGDLDEVSLETSPVPEVDDGGPTPAPSPEETATAIEGLLTDLSDVDVDEDAGPEATAKEIEGLLDDLSTVEVDASSPTTDASAGTGESAVEDVVGAETNRTPADGVADVSATDLFCAFNGEGPVDLPEDLAMADGWGPTAIDAGDRTATGVFEDLGAAVDEVPAVTTPDPEPTTDGPSIEIDLADPTDASDETDRSETDEDVDVPEIDLTDPATETDETVETEGTTTEPGQATERTAETERTMAKTANTDTSSDDVDDLFDGYEEDTPEEIIASADEADRVDEPDDELVGDVAGLFGDLSEVDLEPETDTETETEGRPTTDRAPDSEEAVQEVETMFSDLESVDVEPGPAPEPTKTGPASTDLEPAHERGDDSTVVGRRDVDAVFEGFAEETVEEVMEADDEPATEPEEADEDDEPAEVETGDFMKELAAGKDPEEIGITVYDGSQTGSGTAIAGSDDATSDAGETKDPSPRISTDDLFEEMSTGDADDDAWATVTDTEPVDDASDPSAASPEETDESERAPEPTRPAREPSPPNATDAKEPSSPATPDDDQFGDDRSTDGEQFGDARSTDDERGRYTAGGGGPGSETLFPDADDGDASTIEGSSLDGDDESVIGALKLLVGRVKRRIQSLF